MNIVKSNLLLLCVRWISGEKKKKKKFFQPYTSKWQDLYGYYHKYQEMKYLYRNDII